MFIAHTADKIQSIETLCNSTKLCSFLELGNIFIRFVQNFVHNAALLNRKLQPDQPREFQTHIEKSLQQYRRFCIKKLISSSVLALTYAKGYFMLDTVACDVQVGSVLLQEQPDLNKKPNCFLIALIDKTGTSLQDFSERVLNYRLVCTLPTPVLTKNTAHYSN